MRRRCALALAVLMTLLSLTACSEKTAEADTPSAPQAGDSPAADAGGEPEDVPETERLYPSCDADYQGTDFNIIFYDAVEACAWGNTIPCDIEAEALTGDELNDAVYNRNRTVESALNVRILAESTTNAIAGEIEKQATAGTTDYDAAFPYQLSLSGLISKNALRDLSGAFDYTMPWYDTEALEAFRIAGKTFAAVSDATYMDKMLSIVVLFNQQLAQDYNLGNLYARVLEMEWTFDAMKEMCEAVALDLDGDGVMGPDDRYGVISQNDCVYQLLHASGERFASIGADGVPEITAGGERAVSVLGMTYDFMNREDVFFNRQAKGVDTVGVCSMFAANQALFIQRQIQCAFELRDMTSDFGIIPLPLVTEEQKEYHTSLGYTVSFALTIPASVRDADMSVKVLDLMGAESFYSVNDVLYDTILGAKLLRDEESRDNLRIIFDNRLYDPGCIFDFGGLANSFMTGWKNGSEKIASMLKTNQKMAQKAIDKLMDKLADTSAEGGN